MERSEVIFPAPPRSRPTVTVGTWREDQEEPKFRPKSRKIKLYADRKALRVPRHP